MHVSDKITIIPYTKSKKKITWQTYCFKKNSQASIIITRNIIRKNNVTRVIQRLSTFRILCP